MMINKEKTRRMPAMFIGHGNPMNAIIKNPYREAWLTLGKTLPKPNAILCISAHWQTYGTQVCIVEKSKTIHDFGDFPAELFAQKYPAPGAPEYVKLACDLFPANTIATSYDWGLDHGTWSILQSLFPKAEVHAFQLSLNVNLTFHEHFAIAKQLASLREYDVMIIGSGNIVHNLTRLSMQSTIPDWATNFDNYIKNALETGDEAVLLDIDHAGDSD